MAALTTAAPGLTQRPPAERRTPFVSAFLFRLLAALVALRPPDGWAAAGLLTLNLTIVVWSVEVADWAPTPPLVLVLGIGILTALVLSRIKLWAAVLIPAGLAIGGGVIIWQMTASSPEELRLASAGELFGRLAAWVAAARAEGISVDPLPFGVGLMTAAWLIGFLGGWLFFRRRSFWAVFALGAVGLLSNLTFLPAQASVYLGVYLFTALLLVGWLQSVRARQQWDSQGRVYDGHLGILTVSDTVLVALVALLIAFLLPVGGQWGPANKVYDYSRSPLVRWEEDFNRLFAGLPARKPLPYRIWGDAMAFQGTINPTDTPVLQINSPIPLYWKARSYATYTHEGWLSEGTVLKEPGWQPEYSRVDPDQERFNVTFEVVPNYESRSLFAGGLTVGANRDIRLETFDSPRYVIDPYAGALPEGIPSTLAMAVRAVRDATAQDPAAADEIIAANLPSNFLLESVERDDIGVVQTAIVGEFVPNMPDVLAVRAAGSTADSGVPYQVTSAVSTATAEDLNTANDDYAPWVWTRYTQLPPDMPPRVAELARQITAGAETPHEKAVAVEQYLKNSLDYNLEIDPPPFGEDGVDYFLFDSRQGYSEYFGSAMTVLMRSLGIPARMVTGYSIGTRIRDSQTYVVSDHHSHGWAEVYFQGYGWIPFEPTPGRDIPIVVEPQAQPEQSSLDEFVDPGELPCEFEDECEDIESGFTDEDLELFADGGIRWRTVWSNSLPWIIGSAAMAALLAAVAGIVWRWLLATPSNSVGVYRRLRRLSRFASLGPRPYETPHQWAATVSTALPAQRRDILTIVDAYVGETYSGRQRSAGSPDESVVRAWRGLRIPLALHTLRRRET